MAVPLAGKGEEVTVELDVRVRPGSEVAAERELIALGASQVERRGRGELRVTPRGPLRPLLGAECALTMFAVRVLPGVDLTWLNQPAALRAAVELAAITSSLMRNPRFETFRVTVGPEVPGDRSAIGQLSGQLGHRLGLRPTFVQPDLLLIVRGHADGLEMAVRLPTHGPGPPRPE